MSSSYRMELDRWLAQLDVRAERVLDLGGSQLPVKGRVKTWEAGEYLIADLPEPHVNSPRPDIDVDLNYPLEQRLVETMETFDMVFCLEVFDYIWNPVQAFKNIYNYLSFGGIAWVSFPFVYPTHQPIEDDALRYTEFGIRKLAQVSHLKIINIIPRRPETDAVEQLWRAERLRAAKGYDHNVTGWIVEFQK